MSAARKLTRSVTSQDGFQKVLAASSIDFASCLQNNSCILIPPLPGRWISTSNPLSTSSLCLPSAARALFFPRRFLNFFCSGISSASDSCSNTSIPFLTSLEPLHSTSNCRDPWSASPSVHCNRQLKLNAFDQSYANLHVRTTPVLALLESKFQHSNIGSPFSLHHRSFNCSHPVAKADALATGAARGKGKRIAAVAQQLEGGDDSERQKLEALDAVIRKINEDFGAGTCVPLSCSGPVPDVETFSTGILPLDVALQGGWPRGRIVEVFGHESSGKTSLALYAISEIQKLGQTVVLIDAEHALDMSYAHRLGVITEGNKRLIVVQPNSGDDGINIADYFIRSGCVSLIVVDSVSALVPQQELEGLVGEGSLGMLARLMSMALRRLSPLAAKAGCTVMFLNQIRNKIGGYGNPETTTGGLALKFHASVRCEIRIAERKKNGTEDVGFRARVKVVKSKVSIPYKVAEFDVLHGKGVSRAGALFDVAENFGLVSKRGSFYHINGQVLHGRDRSIKYLEENPEVFSDLDTTIKERIRTGDTAARPVEDDQVDPENESEADASPKVGELKKATMSM